MSDPVYLDFNATTPVLPEVLDAMLPYLREHFGNPSSGHVYGQRARRAVETAREQVAVLIGATVSEVIFTGSATESSNLALRGAINARPGRRQVVISSVEHPATSAMCTALEREGHAVSRIDVDENGQILLEPLQRALSEHTALISLIHGQNETGVLQPVLRVAALASAFGAWLHVDASQSVGKVRVKVAELGAQLLTIAGHKLYAPKGVGALFVQRGITLTPVTRGGNQEHGLRPGTENVASIVGLGAACAIAQRDLEHTEHHLRTLRDELHARLRDRVPGLALNGHPTERLPNTLNVRFPQVLGSALLAACPQVAASTGSACHDGHEEASSVILAMGVAPSEAVGTVRLSVGRTTTSQDVVTAANALADAWAALTPPKR